MQRHRLPSPLRQLSVALLIAFAPAAWATTYPVNSSATLGAALASAVHGDVINFTGNVTLTSADLPALQKNLTVEGNGYALSGNNQFRGLFVYAGTTSVKNLRIVNTVATGGAGGFGGVGKSADPSALTGAAGGGGAGLGGGLFVNAGAVVTISNVQFSGAAAQGGAGGDTGRRGEVQSYTHGYGGGGGMGQDGVGMVIDTASGGGGGLGRTTGHHPYDTINGIVLGAASGGRGTLNPQTPGAGGGNGTLGGFSSSTPVGAGGGGGVGGRDGSTLPFVNASAGGSGGFGGGGGGGQVGGTGGFGGGGGAGGAVGGRGGFGGGGGSGATAGAGGFGAGAGSTYAATPNGVTGGGGGGGAGLGGALFVAQGGTLTIAGSTSASGGSAVGGQGGVGGYIGSGYTVVGSPGGNGSGYGAGMFLQGNGSLSLSPGAGQTQSFADAIADQTGSGGTGANAGSWALVKTGAGTLALLGQNTYSGGTQINAGVVQINSASSLGSGAVSLAGGTLHLAAGTVTLGNAMALNTGGGSFQVDGGASLSLTQAVGGSGGFSKTGAGTLALNAGLTTPQLALSAGTLAVSTATITAGGTGAMSGGSFSGTLVNHGRFSHSGGSFNGALTNASAGTLGLTTVLRAGGAVVNQGRVDLDGLSAGLVGSTLRNDGVIQVTGGGIRLNSAATLGVTAAGQSIIHNGKLVVDNATLAVTSNMLNAQSSTVEVKGGSWAVFQGSFMGGQVDVAADSIAFFLGKVLRVTGVDFSGAGTKYYNGGLAMFFDMPGLMVDAGSVAFGSANVLTLSIGGTTECTSTCVSDVSQRYSHYTVAGGLALDGVLKLGSASGFVAHAGDHFDLLDWDSLQGRFSGIDTSGFKLAAGTRLDTSRLYTSGEISISAVPEPAHWALLLAGLAGLGWRVRRQPAGQASV